MKGDHTPRIGDPGSFDNPDSVTTGCKKTSKINYSDLKRKLLSRGRTFVDDEFPAEYESLVYSESPPCSIVWKRPPEICSNPQLFVDDASRFDVQQGQLGDCWLLAAVASLTLNKRLLKRVVPDDQGFDERNYCGAFHFRFWQYGRWVDVIIDDRLPCNTDGELVYLQSTEKNEFWSALLEKAYAKLHGCYEALQGGLAAEGMEDFTGGVSEMINLKDNSLGSHLFSLMKKGLQRGCLMSCSIPPRPGMIEARLRNGLIAGHAYSVTGAEEIETDRYGDVQLVRVRNPWGDHSEWEGRWSDSSLEWKSLMPGQREELGLTFADDGEFWMSFDDFRNNFVNLEFCNVTDVILHREDKKFMLKGLMFEGGWVRGCSAGGCRNNRDTFWRNPQYRFDLKDPDEEDDEDLCTCIISLTQKDRRFRKKQGLTRTAIGFELYKLPDKYKDEPGSLDRRFFERYQPEKSSSFIDKREVVERWMLKPGSYVVVTSTFDKNEEANYVLRILSEHPGAPKEMEEDDTVDPAVINPPKESKDVEAQMRESFIYIAGDDGEIDHHELYRLLKNIFSDMMNVDQLTLDLCKSFVCLLDQDFSGKLGSDEFVKLWRYVKWCKRAFNEFDKTRTGDLNSFEFKDALGKAGFHLSNKTLRALTLRYANNDETVSFIDFLACGLKLKQMIEHFEYVKRSQEGIPMNKWLELTMFT